MLLYDYISLYPNIFPVLHCSFSSSLRISAFSLLSIFPEIQKLGVLTSLHLCFQRLRTSGSLCRPLSASPRLYNPGSSRFGVSESLSSNVPELPRLCTHVFPHLHFFTTIRPRAVAPKLFSRSASLSLCNIASLSRFASASHQL